MSREDCLVSVLEVEYCEPDCAVDAAYNGCGVKLRMFSINYGERMWGEDGLAWVTLEPGKSCIRRGGGGG